MAGVVGAISRSALEGRAGVAGLDSTWKDSGMRLYLRLDGIDSKAPKGSGGTRGFTEAPDRAPLPEDLASQEVHNNGQDTSKFGWTETLDQAHAKAVRRVVRRLDHAACRREKVMEAISATAKGSCHMEAHRDAYRDLLAELASTKKQVAAASLLSHSPLAATAAPGSPAVGATRNKGPVLSSTFTKLMAYNRAAFDPAAEGARATRTFDNLPSYLKSSTKHAAFKEARAAEQALAATTPVEASTTMGKGKQLGVHTLRPSARAAELAALLPPGVHAWDIVTAPKMSRPTPSHAAFVASGVKHRTAAAAFALSNATEIGGGTHVRAGLAKDVSELVRCLSVVDRDVLYDQQRSKRSASDAAFQAHVSEAIGAPYKLLADSSIEDELSRLTAPANLEKQAKADPAKKKAQERREMVVHRRGAVGIGEEGATVTPVESLVEVVAPQAMRRHHKEVAAEEERERKEAAASAMDRVEVRIAAFGRGLGGPTALQHRTMAATAAASSKAAVSAPKSHVHKPSAQHMGTATLFGQPKKSESGGGQKNSQNLSQDMSPKQPGHKYGGTSGQDSYC